MQIPEKQHGGARDGCGQKPRKTNPKVKTFYFDGDVNDRIDAEVARRNGARKKGDPKVTATQVLEELVRANLSR